MAQGSAVSGLGTSSRPVEPGSPPPDRRRRLPRTHEAVAHGHLLRLPGVYAPEQDTWLLADALHAEMAGRSPRGRCVLELGTGSGALAVLAAGYRGSRVTAVDVSRRALLCAGINAAVRGRWLRLRRGDLTAPVTGDDFDVIVANPPYVPAASSMVPVRGAQRAWDAGTDGRAVLDRLCAEAPKRLAAGGTLLIVHSALAGVDRTVHQLRGDGLDTQVIRSCSHRFGPVLRSRADFLHAQGLLGAREGWEELAVVRATRTHPDEDPASSDAG